MNTFKNLKFFLFLLILINCKSFSQDGWFWLNPLPQGNWLTDVEFTSNNTVYVSGYGGTMMKSTNGGVNFEILANKECGKQIIFINNLTGFSSSANGILKTTNGGNNWRFIPAPVDSVSGYILSPAPLLYGKKSNKIYLSRDLGENWILSLTAYQNEIIYSSFFLNSNTGYAVGSKPDPYLKGRIYRTTSSGISWDTINAALAYGLRSVNFINSNTGFAITFSQPHLIKTTNGGYTWVTILNLVNSSFFNEIVFFDINNGYIKGPYDILCTSNQGSNWYWYSTGPSKNTFLKNLDEGLGIGTYENQNYLYRTTNTGANWLNLSTGFNDDFYDVTFINESTGFTGGYDNIYKTTNGGTNWSVFNLGLEIYDGVNCIIFLNNNTGYAGIDGGQIAKTTNCGLNWHVIQTISTDYIMGISFPDANIGYAITYWGSCMKSTDGGSNWNYLPDGNGHNFRDIIFINNQFGFSGGYDNDSDKAIVRKTDNGGADWTKYYLDSMTSIRDLCMTPNNSLFAAGYNFNSGLYNGVIYRTTDFGNTWLYNRFPKRITSIFFSSVLTGYASTDNNITYKTTNSGVNWFATYCSNNFESLGMYFTNDLTGYAVSPYGQIIKTTTGGGVLISVEPQSYIVPHTFNLYQNYPNPFNPTTKIKFDIPKAMNASLRIYDILGREVSVVVNDFLIPGTYAFDFDGSNLSSGVYFYVLTGEGFVESKKMLLVK
ncbi:MAG: T9SS type A sorting domain-containing protein [Ignavibacteria bacterium]|nr:T9SS type A sorting domain-containing protein [Ignavibacteria bacterium]